MAGEQLFAFQVWHAAERGQEAEVQRLMATRQGKQSGKCQFTTPLMMAAASGHLQAAELLLACDASTVNAQQTNNGWTALHHATSNDQPELVKCLLEHGADAGMKRCDGLTALDLAKLWGRFNCTKILEGRVIPSRELALTLVDICAIPLAVWEVITDYNGPCTDVDFQSEQKCIIS
eukprot:gb/GEZN01017591.1/.p1 GENE.gb/GEZN01017591.1/~~gb/GEZN01017591.1/.p1  ORF type:complete len:200 (+),score=32.99 gb/GEZN01017591.1/:72-602(+)